MHLYIHVPFCARRCSYCDFAIAVRREVPSTRYAEAVLREWEGLAREEIWSRSPAVDTIYFGGGTPSLLEPPELARILTRIRSDRVVAPDAELTLEANPDDVTAPRASAWRAMGINRVSLGVQSFDPAVLDWMHRTHAAEQVPVAVEILRAAGIADLSLDLIFALPDAQRRDWQRDLDRALALGPNHLSLYGLTVEPHTPLGRWVERGVAHAGSDDRYAEEFLVADARLREAGFEHYEVSNYARPGHRARHNSAYWERAPFLGLGPSAHSGWERRRRWNLREWSAWESALREGKSPVAGEETLDDEALDLEQTYLGLRTSRGVPASWIPEADRRAWTASGWLTGEMNGYLALTADGWLRLDSLVGHLKRGVITS
ncbi:MAG TPA: radical SAM family heme chaperone HemW [Gemmatimonadales bacterium]|nr:radical SAM family heme chaperone HemW [Gemmatimonadales bacterium]